jgi:ATP-binding cassette subfamily B protein
MILKQLGNLKRKTVIAVTHKLNIVDWADRLIVVDQGRVVQEGDRDKLLRNPGDTLKRLLKDIEK